MNFKNKKINYFVFLPILVLVFLVVGAKSSFAGDFYVAQNISGNDDGSNCANAHSVVWFNDTSNWANPKQENKIGPSDMVHLCNTISTPLTIQNSGSMGSPIIILFENGAKLSRDHWNGANNDSAIFGGGYSQEISHITIDGGVNGVIEATDNGTNKTYQLNNHGIRFRYGSNITVKNVTIQHIYDRVESLEDNAFGSCIYFENNTHDVSIVNNQLYDASNGINISYRVNDYNIAIGGNSGGRFGHAAISLGCANIDTTLSDVSIFDNNFTKGREWSGQPSIHTNLIHAFAVLSGSRIDNLKIYRNRFSGQCGTNSTSLVFLEGNVYTPWIYNNLLIKESDPGGACGNGLMYLKNGSSNCIVANNTFVGDGTGIGFDIVGSSDGILKNNLFFNVADPVISPYDVTSLSAIDNNVYYNSSSPIFNWGSYGQLSFSQWLSALEIAGLVDRDLNTSTSMPDLDAEYLPTINDSVVRNSGVDLSVYFTTDKAGTSRPQGSAWDIGAYEFVEESALQADFDSDGDVDIFDYNILIGNFGTTGDCGNQADTDADCDVDIFDYSVLMGEFGSGT